jgi:O-antigen ligase
MPVPIPIPPYFLQLESLLFIPFLGMLLAMQLSRYREALYSLTQARRMMWSLLALFGLLTFAFGTLLLKVSPLLAFELSAGFTLALIHPVNALCFMVYLLFLRPWDILPDNHLLAALPRLLAVTCVFSWLIHPWKHVRPSRVSWQALMLLSAFGGWLFLSTFITPNIGETQAAWFDTFFKAVIVFIMCSFFIDNRRSVSEFQNTILYSIFTMAALGLYQYFTQPVGVLGVDRLHALSMLDPNDLAAISVIALPLALTTIVGPARGFSLRMTGIVFVAAALMAIWYAQSRGAMIAVLVQLLGFMVVKYFARQRFLTMLGVGIVIVGYIGLLGSLQRSEEDLYASKESRITYWKAATRMAIRNPILGVGYDQYPEKYEAYSPTSIKYEFGHRTAHSSWFLAYAESGLLGGSLFLAFFLIVLKTAWRNRRDYPDQFFALGGYGVAMSFLSHTYLLFPYLLYGLVIASDTVKERTSHAA